MFFKFLYSNRALKWLLIFQILFGIGCSDLPFSDKVDQGSIEYEITYPDIPDDSYLLDLMPKKMETKFIDGSFRSDIVAGMGLFKTSIICEKGKQDLTHSVKMLNKKYASTLNSEEIKEFNPEFQKVKITPLDEVKEIAGYKCLTAKVTVEGDSSWEFKVHYTKDIKLENANLHTPFKEIEGVLMQYDILSYDTHMRFTANKVSPEEINNDDIVLEDGYKMVSADELKKEIESIFSKVK